MAWQPEWPVHFITSYGGMPLEREKQIKGTPGGMGTTTLEIGDFFLVQGKSSGLTGPSDIPGPADKSCFCAPKT